MQVVIGKINGEKPTPETEIKYADVSTGADIVSLFSGGKKIVYIPVTIQIKGNPVEFHIEKLSPKKEAAVDAKINRQNGRAVNIMARDQENVNAAAILIAETFHVKEGESYFRVFEVDELLGTETELGLFDYPDAKDLSDLLSANAYAVNPALMPALKKMAERMAMLQYGV